MQTEVVHHMCTHVVSTPARLATLILVAHAVSMPRLQTATSRYAYREKVNRAVPRRRRILKLKKLQILEFAKLPAAAWLGNQCRPPVANYKRCGLFEHCSSVLNVGRRFFTPATPCTTARHSRGYGTVTRPGWRRCKLSTWQSPLLLTS